MIRISVSYTGETLGMSIMNRNRQQNATQVANLHRENLQKNLQRRIEAARMNGDTTLLRLLEAEANYLR
jgi:hypothetical protein